MGIVTMRFSDEEDALLRENAAKSGLSITDFIKSSLAHNSEAKSLTTAVESLIGLKETEPSTGELFGVISDLAKSQQEALARIEFLENSLSTLIGHITEQRKQIQQLHDTPFGLRLAFVQGAVQCMNVFGQHLRDEKPQQFAKYADSAKQKSQVDFTG